MNLDLFLDLWDILVNELFGDIWLFIFLSLIALWILGMKYKISTEANILFSILFISIAVAKAMDSLRVLWVLVVLFIGAFFYLRYQKIMRRG